MPPLAHVEEPVEAGGDLNANLNGDRGYEGPSVGEPSDVELALWPMVARVEHPVEPSTGWPMAISRV